MIGALLAALISLFAAHPMPTRHTPFEQHVTAPSVGHLLAG